MERFAQYDHCMLCPRACGADRNAGQLGRCHAPAALMVARAALHMWEEPCISGEEGSGAVFFSGCSLGCIYCQNRTISGAQSGKVISVERLKEISLELQAKGANNINLVTPDHYAPSIAEALRLAAAAGLKIPVICNCSGYMTPETIAILAPYVDVWLPDFKYASREMAAAYSAAGDYFEIASEALREMVRLAGPAEFDDRGMIRRGVIVRHLLLPGGEQDSARVLAYLHETYGDQIYISIMSQYTPPEPPPPDFPEILKRKVDYDTYEALVDLAIDLGVENGFIQEEGTADESFIPAFDNEGV